MVLPAAAVVESWACTRRQLVDAAALSIHNRARRSIRARIHRVWYSISVQIRPADGEILVHQHTPIGGIVGIIYDLEIAAERAVVNDPLLKIAELQRWAPQS